MSFGVGYLLYLSDERAKYGDNGIRDHVVVASQTLVGGIFSTIDGIGGRIAGTAAAPGAGTIVGGVGGAITTSITYDIKNIGGKPLKDWVGDFARSTFPEQQAKKDGFQKNDQSFPQGSQTNPDKYHIGNDFKYENPFADFLNTKTAFAEQLKNSFNTNQQGFSFDNIKEPNIDPASFQSAYDRYSHHSSGSTKTYEVKKGDTIWKVAKNHGMTVDELLRVPGNEYLRNHGKSFDDLGRVNILIKPGFKINIPNEQEYRQHTWNHHSTYGDPIRTTTGHYSFMNDFNLLRAR